MCEFSEIVLVDYFKYINCNISVILPVFGFLIVCFLVMLCLMTIIVEFTL